MKSLGKILAIIAVFIVCLVLLIMIKGHSDSGKKIHKMIFIEDTDQWGKCDLVRCTIDLNSNSIAFYGGVEDPQLTTPVLEPGFPFDELMLSWNSTPLPESSALNFEVSVSADGAEWYDFQYNTYGTADSSELSRITGRPGTIDGIGRVSTDILELDKPMKYARATVKALISGESNQTRLRRLNLCFAAGKSSWADYRKFKSVENPVNIGKVKLSVPYYTQRGLPRDISGNCCSPTSVTMVLNYHEKGIDLESFCRQVYDPYHDMYGNWPYNVETAYIGGMSKTWVEIHSSFDEIYPEIMDGKPVVISIAYGYDELPNSPIHEASVGHLIAVVGFDGPDTVICNDPAGHGPEDGIVPYPRKELEKVWLDHGGVAYHLWP